jgi:hypothetical protein
VNGEEGEQRGACWLGCLLVIAAIVMMVAYVALISLLTGI